MQQSTGLFTRLGFLLLFFVGLGRLALAQSWVQLAPQGGPPPVKFFGASVLYDPSTNRLILFGGNNGFTTTNDVWILTNANGLGGTPTWTQLAPVGGPPAPRDNHAAVYDPASNRMIIFGGCEGGCLPALNDVWVLTNANGLGGTPTWTQLAPSGGPPAPRIAMASAYDPASNELILFGGQNGGGFAGATFPEVWVLSNANGSGGAPVWTNAPFSGGPAPGQYRTSYSFDTANNRLIVAGGAAFGSGLATNAAWVLSGANNSGPTPSWTNVVAENPSGPPPDFTGRTAAFDPATGSMILVGDSTDGTADLDAWVLKNANGVASPTTWTQLLPTGGLPPAAEGAQGAGYDPANNRLIVFFGVIENSLVSNQVWVLTGANGAGSVIPAPNTQCVTPPSGMVAWWRAEGDATDFLGNSDGSLINGASFAPGAVGQAFSFNGFSQFVDAGNSPPVQVSAGDFTVDAWVKFDTLVPLPGAPRSVCSGVGCDQSIVDKMHSSAGGIPNVDGWRLLKQADNHFWFCLGGGTFNNCGGVHSTTSAVAGAWFHIAAVKTDATSCVFVNGVQESCMVTPAFTDTNSTNVLIGAQINEGSFFNGLIDEVEIFNRALSTAEIQSIFNAGTAGKCAVQADKTPPTTTATPSPVANSAGWNNTSVTVSLNATDNSGGSGVKQITFGATGAQPIASTTVAGATASVTISSEGVTTISYFAIDNAGNAEAAKTLTVQIDETAPSTTETQSPVANAAGWNNSNVTVSLSAADNSGGSGVKQITFSAIGAQSIAQTIVPGGSASFTITAEGVTTLSYFATDIAGNIETAKTLTIQLDKTPPAINCGSPDAVWHATDVVIGCTASDNGSGLDSNSAANFTLTTSVPQGAETAAAFTNSRTLCDIAGNCSVAGPIGPNMVDKKPPQITIAAPAATGYKINQAVASNYACVDGGSGVATCAGPVPSGNNFDTASAGAKTFTVNSTDNVGNASSQSISYSVGYAACLLYDDTHAARSGSTIPIKFQLCDAAGHDVSSSRVTVNALHVVMLSTNASTTVDDAGDANPDSNFRFDPTLGPAGGYIFNLQTTGLATGTYVLTFSVAGDPTVHNSELLFQVR